MKAILDKLLEIEERNRVKILFAVEAGSRTYGYSSAQSDYDIKFVFSRPTFQHISMLEPRDVIEGKLPDQPNLLEFHGWDSRKALQLLLKGNATLAEWLQSPTIYTGDTILSGWVNFTNMVHKRTAVAYHYRSLMCNTWYKKLVPSKAPQEVDIKDYFYAVRPLLALRFMRNNKMINFPPVIIRELVRGANISQAEIDSLEYLINLRKSSPDIKTTRRMHTLDAMICLELENEKPLPDEKALDNDPVTISRADRLFRESVMEADAHLTLVR